MTPEQIAMAAIAAAVAFWPNVADLAKKGLAVLRGRPAGPSVVPGGVSFEAAVHDLASVRSRLVATGHLGDEQKSAIDALTLALVSGSDK